jgi:membrane-associated protease RseP (regulator of RpoE activity)
MDYNKIRKICRPIRIVVGLSLIAVGVITGNSWFFLGVVPLVAGIANFCPLCIITKKCDLPEVQEVDKEEN